MLTDAYLDDSIPLRTIKASRYSVREGRIPGGGNAIRQLTDSIHQHGLLNPIIVRPVKDGFEIVAGNRRFEACKLLHWKHVPAKVKELSEKEAFEVQLIENIQRKTFDPIEEAKAFNRYTSEFGWGGESELARKIYRSEQYVSSRIQLLRLPKEIIEGLSNNQLKVSQALEIVNLEEKDQKLVNDAIVNENLTVRDVRNITKSLRENNTSRARRGRIEDGYDTYPTNMLDSSCFENTLNSVKQKIKILQKAQLCLKISLYRLDTLINESENKLDQNMHSEVNNTLMDYRHRIHSMIDENLKEIAKLNKKSW